MAIASTLRPALVVQASARTCALPLDGVVEIMRPLAATPVAAMPAFVRGLAVIRGTPAPVIDLGALLGTPCTVANRWVLLRLGARRAALQVDRVLGVQQLNSAALQSFPPLLADAHADLVEAIEMRDRELLLVLQLAKLAPEHLWPLPDAGEVSA